LLPGLAFDSDRNRIGFGAGYYDKYLNQFMSSNIEHAKKPSLVGTFYEWQRVATIKTFTTDVKLDCIITELKIYK
jgi:5-formyltetrahydrofolate cyclo-ligase